MIEQTRPEELLTRCQRLRQQRDKRFISEFPVLKEALSAEHPSNQRLITLLAKKYSVNEITVRRTLKAAEVI